jgi:hypothetical protein
MVAAERTKPLTKEELQSVRAIVKIMMSEPDRDKLRTLLEQLRRIVHGEPPEERPN